MKRFRWLVLAIGVMALAPPPAPGGMTWIVDDPSDPVPLTGTLTLRQAITQANTFPGSSHHIVFQVPMPGMVGIPLQFALPTIQVDSVWIDGWSQPGASPGALPPSSATLLVMLDGSLAGPCHGLVLESSFNTVEGLSIVNFEQDGIRIQGTAPPGTRGNSIHGNFIGTEVTGTMGMGNGTNPTGGIWAGVDVLCTPGPLTFCFGNRVTHNLISENYRCGVQISSCPPSDCYANQVLFNWIGSDITGSQAFGNLGTGVSLSEGTHDNLIDGNAISANGANGVDLTGNSSTVPPAFTDRNQISNNLIGIAGDGITPHGNGARGIGVGVFEHASYWGYCRDNMFQANTVANNARCGAAVWEAPTTTTNCDRNTFLANVYCNNGGPAIDLGDDGLTLNDPGDLDSGADQQLNHPLVMVAAWSGGVTVLQGIVEGGADVHLYRGATGPSPCVQGVLWLGSVSPDALGNWGKVLPGLMPGDLVTAIAMDWAGVTTSNTSEFAPAMVVQNAGGVPEQGPVAFGLSLAGASPFRHATALRCRLAVAAPARLEVYDVTGQRVRTLLEGMQPAGERTIAWDGRDEQGRPVRAGVYFARLVSGSGCAVCRVVRL